MRPGPFQSISLCRRLTSVLFMSGARFAHDADTLANLTAWSRDGVGEQNICRLVDVGVNAPAVQKGWAERSHAAGVHGWLLTGCSVKGSRLGQKLCREQTSPLDMRFTAGVHPHDSGTWTDESEGIIRALVSDPNCGAVGECGLDYDRMKAPRETQLTAFAAQVAIAVEAQKPLFLHCRELDAERGPPIGAHVDLLQILSAAGAMPSQCCVHCFTGSATELRELLHCGFTVGITGFVCKSERGAGLRTALASMSAEFGAAEVASQLVLETDAPYMRPPDSMLRMPVTPSEIKAGPEGAPLSKAKGNEKAPPLALSKGRDSEPAMTVAVCRTVAECLGVTPKMLAAATTARSSELFFSSRPARQHGTATEDS